MERSPLKPLVPRQRLTPIPDYAIGAAVGVGVGVASNLVSQWIWEIRINRSKRKAKQAKAAGLVFLDESLEVQFEEETKIIRRVKVALTHGLRRK